jgi:hypothetical protein
MSAPKIQLNMPSGTVQMNQIFILSIGIKENMATYKLSQNASILFL